ncbi:hypothetical protein [Phaeobacter sp. 11ANDIMAR09]
MNGPGDKIFGRRFLSAPLVRLAGSMQMHLGHVAQANGRWRV